MLYVGLNMSLGELLQLVVKSYGNSLQRVVVTRLSDLW